MARRAESGAMPQDVKLSPDGRVFYVADMMANGVWLVDAKSFKANRVHPHRRRRARPLRQPRFQGPLRLQPKRGLGLGGLLRDSEGRQEVAHPGGGSPDMGGVSADGKILWLSGRYNSEVYAISTKTGSCSRASRWATARTGSASTRNRVATRSGTRASFADASRRVELGALRSSITGTDGCRRTRRPRRR